MILIEWLKSIAIALVIVWFLSLFFRTTTVVNISMLPTLHEGDALVLKRSNSFERGDIVSFRSEFVIKESDRSRLNAWQKLFVKAGDRMLLIKRIIGVPGDRVDIEKGKVFINGKELEEPYLDQQTLGDLHIQSIPEGKYLLLGDNRSVSMDSRNSKVGLVDQEDIIGKAIFRYWPITRMRIFRRPF